MFVGFEAAQRRCRRVLCLVRCRGADDSFGDAAAASVSLTGRRRRLEATCADYPRLVIPRAPRARDKG